jgi:hypothetical protein
VKIRSDEKRDLREEKHWKKILEKNIWRKTLDFFQIK